MRPNLILLAVLAVAPSALFPAADPSPTIHFIDGPAAVTLGAEATLELPAGWRFVPKTDLGAYFAGGPRRLGAWDRGLVLTAEPARELRLVFEPLGAVAEAPVPDPAALLPEAQALAAARARKLGLSDGLQRTLVDWRWEPTYDAARQVLRFGGFWREAGEESVDLHLRWLGRRGVLKLDWRGNQGEADDFSALSEALDEALRFNEGQRLADAQPGDPRAAMDLGGLVLDGLFGRGAVAGGAPPAPERPLWQWIAAGLALAAALAWVMVRLWRVLASWMQRRARARQEARRLDYIEKKFGSAADVEEIEEEGQLGYDAKEGKP
jgi:uncharacterized membrane-anchored protein